METRKSSLIKKFVSILIIFSMMLMNCVPILSNVSFAADDPTSNVEVKGYFSGDSFENTNSLICDVNDETIKINFEVTVKGNGYFKSGVLKFDNNLNFELQPDSEINFKDNQLKLPEVSSSANLNISIPIAFAVKDNFTVEDLSRVNKVVFKGEYVDNEGILYTVERELNFELSWKEVTSSKINYEVIKNLDFEKDGVKGKILQTKVKLSGNIENKLPIKSTEISVDIPQAEGLEFSEVTVDVDKLLYTQGREDFSTDFTSANYRVEDGKVIIDIENYEEDGKISIGNGEDSYILTFVYNGEVVSGEEISGKILANIVSYANDSEDVETEISYNLYESIGETVQYLRENKETPISKGYLLADSKQEKYEITYVKKDILSVSRADVVVGLEIDDVDEYFVNENGDYAYTTSGNAFYKKTEFSKENLINVLGENGKVEILNMNDEVIGTITFDMETDENDSFVVEYEANVSEIKIRFSDPVADGNISVVNTKSIRSLNYSRDEIKSFDRLVSHAQGFATYNEGITTDLGIVESSIEISKISSGATIEVENPNLSTTVVNESVNFKLRLNNNEDTSDLYENPVFEIRLPEVIKEVNIRNIDMFYANGELEIANIENFVDGANQVIRITLSGIQSSYGINKETNGTVISFDVDLALDELSMNGSGNVELYYYNASATRYDNEVNWLITVENDTGYELMNGSSKFEITYTAPNGLVNAQATETKETTSIEEEQTEQEENEGNQSEEADEEENKNRVVSTKQGAQSELLEEGTPAKLATMFISVMNNSSRSYYNFKILGRIPFVGNRDILTGEDLGTTVDTILDTEISGQNDLPYTVYYSENPDATENLNDANNNWRTDFYKMGGVKSYLIVFDENYVFEPNTKLEFEYDYVIPANLKSGDAFYGTYASYFIEQSTNLSSNDGADKVGYETLENAEIEASIGIKDNVVKELSDAEVEIRIKNNTDVDAQNVVCEIPVVNGLSASYVKYDGAFNVIEYAGSTYINIDEILGNSEQVIVVGFTTFGLKSYDGAIKLTASISADNSEEVYLESNEVGIEEKNFNIFESGIYETGLAGVKKECMFKMTSLSENTLNNVKIEKTLDKRISVTDVYLEDGTSIDYYYDKSTGIMTMYLGEVQPFDSFSIKYTVEMSDSGLSGSEYIINSKTTVTSDDSEKNIEYENEIKFNLIDLEIELVNNEETGFASNDEEIEYIYSVRNNTNIDFSKLQLVLETSDNFKVEMLEVEGYDKNEKFVNTDSFDTAVYISLDAKESIKVIAKGKIIGDSSDMINAILNAKIFDKEVSSQKDYTLIEDPMNTNGRKLTGIAYIDSNKNMKADSNEQILSGLIVELFDSNTNRKIDSAITDVSGRYKFNNLENGNYFVKFNFDDTKYILNVDDSEGLIKSPSGAIRINNSYVTDNINVEDKSISNINLSLSDDNIFDLKLEARVEKMTIQNSAENSEFINENSDLAKVDIDPKLVSDSKVLLEYKIKVTNHGTIAGTVKSLVDYMPDDLEFDSSLNPNWYQDSDGNIYTRILKDTVIEPGESQELRLILIKKMNSENTGLVHNSFEIAEASNDRGIADIDSTPGNRLDEDDLANADAIIGITTGLTISIIPIVIVSIIILIPIAFLVWKKIDERRYV